MLNGNNVVVGSGEVCDACVVAALRGWTEEIAKYWYGKLETCPENANMGIYLKTSGPGFVVVLCGREGIREGYPSAEAVRRSCATEAKKRGSVTVIL